VRVKELVGTVDLSNCIEEAESLLRGRRLARSRRRARARRSRIWRDL